MTDNFYLLLCRLSLQGQAASDRFQNGYVSGQDYNQQIQHDNNGAMRRPDLSRFDEREEARH